MTNIINPENLNVSVLCANRRVYLQRKGYESWHGTPWILYRGHRDWRITTRNNPGTVHAFNSKAEALNAAKTICQDGARL